MFRLFDSLTFSRSFELPSTKFKCLAIVLVVLIGSMFSNAENSAPECLKTLGVMTIPADWEQKVSDSLLLDRKLGLIRCVADELPESAGNLVNLLKERSELLESDSIANLLLDWSKVLFDYGLDSISQLCVDQALVSGQQSNIQNLRSRCFHIMATMATANNKRYAAMPLIDSALVHLNGEDPALEARLLMDLGRLYYDVGDYPSAMKYYSEARNVFESAEIIHEDYGGLMHYIGSVFKRQYEDSIAATYYQKMIEIGEEHNLPLVKAEGLYLLADVYGYAGDLEMELSCTFKALDIYEQEGDETGIVQSLLALARAYYYGGDHPKAIEFCNKALERNQGRSKTIDFNGHRYLGRIYAKQGDYKTAQEFFAKALVIAESTEEKRWINLKNLYYTIAGAYVNQGDWESAYEALEKYINYQDTLVMKENRNVVFELEQRYEKEKKEAEILVLNKDAELQSSRLAKQRIALIASTLGILLILVIAYSIYTGKKRAERAERHKEQFLANMSHEIRTPMHAVSGMTKILLRNQPKEDQKKYLKAISESASNLLVILNDILDLSKVEDGKLTIEQIPIDLRRVIENVVNMLKEKAEEKEVALAFQLSDEVPQMIIGDPTRLTQILLNLIGNALKFTEEGSIEVLAKVVKDDLVVSIKDTGIGIPKNKLEQVFGSFEQVDLSTTRRFGGTGLGLSITKKLVELQHGRIWVESELGKGSVFSFSLPMLEAEIELQTLTDTSDTQLKELGAELGEIRILLAEDDDFNVMVATDDLKYFLPDSIVEVARNGNEAVQLWKTSRFDIILMDIHMPQLNGLDASREIRRLEKANGSERIPIVAMTASLLKAELDKCIDAGMDAYVPKPYSTDELIGTLYRMCKH